MAHLESKVMKRRTALGCVVGAMAAIAGCTTEDGPQVGLRSVSISNRRHDPVEIAVSITKDDTERYNETHTLEERGVNLEKDWMGERTNYAVTVTVPDEGLEGSVTTAELENLVSDWRDTECYFLRFIIYDDNVGPAVGGAETC